MKTFFQRENLSYSTAKIRQKSKLFSEFIQEQQHTFCCLKNIDYLLFNSQQLLLVTRLQQVPCPLYWAVVGGANLFSITTYSKREREADNSQLNSTKDATKYSIKRGELLSLIIV